MMLFSGNQLHSTVPNTSGRTRFSIDFRTVNIDDVQSRVGRRRTSTPNARGHRCETSCARRDFERIAEDVALAYEGLTPADA